jgi:hypothetical protein
MSRPRIPNPVARQLRQEAGFGCCRCGLPIYEYHHIVPYHGDDPYPPGEMMILCPLCHDLATKGGLPQAEQWTLKGHPHNIEAGVVEGALVMNQDYCAIAVGGCVLVGEGIFLAIGGDRLLSLGIARPVRTMWLSLSLYDADDKLLVAIENNEWISGDPLPWDIRSDHQQLSIRRKSGDISLELDARAEPITIRAQLWRHGEAIKLDPDGIRLGASGQVAIMDVGLAGLALDLDVPNRTAKIIPDPRFGVGALVSAGDPSDRLQQTVDAWERARVDKERGMSRNDPCWCGSGLKLKRCHAL